MPPTQLLLVSYYSWPGRRNGMATAAAQNRHLYRALEIAQCISLGETDIDIVTESPLPLL